MNEIRELNVQLSDLKIALTDAQDAAKIIENTMVWFLQPNCHPDFQIIILTSGGQGDRFDKETYQFRQ